MNKVVVLECTNLIDYYKLNKNIIIQQLQTLNIEENQNFIIGYKDNSRFTLMGKIKNNKVILEYIKKKPLHIKK
jgi:hypothetical protein